MRGQLPADGEPASHDATPWRDARLSPAERAEALLPLMSVPLPGTYLSPPLGRRSKLSSIDPTPAYPFGHGRELLTSVRIEPLVAVAHSAQEGRG